MLLKYMNNKKGGAEILAFIVVLPFILWLFTYLIFGGLFLIEVNELTTITNKKLEIASVQGQFTTTIKNELVEELNSKGYKNLEIIITPSEASDANNSTYVKRSNEIKIKVICKQVHPFYYLNFGLSKEENFYPKTNITGMSEKW